MKKEFEKIIIALLLVIYGTGIMFIPHSYQQLFIILLLVWAAISMIIIIMEDTEKGKSVEDSIQILPIIIFFSMLIVVGFLHQRDVIDFLRRMIE